MSRPVPVPDSLSEGFWRAASEHRLVVQRCASCGWLSYPPTEICGRCLANQTPAIWEEVTGGGTLRSWTVVHVAFLPDFAPLTPYVVGVAELTEQEGLRVVARLVDSPTESLSYGAPVETVFEEVSEGISVPLFRLAKT